MSTRLNLIGRAVAVSAVTSLAFGIAGCGDQAPSGAGVADPNKTVKVDNSDALSKTEIMTAAYQSSVKAGSAHMTMTMTAKGQQVTDMQGDVSYGGGKPSMQATMTVPQLGSRKMEMRYVGNIMYMQIPGMTPSGKFVAIDPRDSSSPMAKSFAGLSDQMDPMASLKRMQTAVQSADRVGKGTVQGVAVDHYKVVVDTKKAIGDAGGLAQQAQGQLPKTITYDLWLDSENLMRRMTFEVVGTAAEIEMSKWGEPVTVRRPAQSDIVKPPTS
jgi:lipoprotein LprG